MSGESAEKETSSDYHLVAVSAHLRDEFNAVAYSPDGKRIATASYDTVRIWEAASGRLLQTLEGHSNTVTCVSWSGDSERIASGSDDSTVRIWEAASGRLLQTLEGHSNWVTSVSWSGDCERIASGSYDSTVRIWEAASGRLLQTLEGHSNSVTSVSWSGDSERIASGSYDRRVRIWEAASGRLLQTLEEHSSYVTSVSWSGDSERIASGSGDGTVRIWKAGYWWLLQTLKGHSSNVTSVSWSDDSERIASGSSDNTVRIWEAWSGRLLQTLEGHSNAVTSASWSGDSERIASADSDGTVRIWEAWSGRLLQTLEGHLIAVTGVSWSGDSERIASGSEDSTVRIWEAGSGRLLQTLEGHSSCVTSVSWSGNGERIASGSEDSTVRIWEAGSGRLLQKLQGHSSCVTSVSWSGDSERIASGSSDSTVRIWDTGSGRLLQTLEGHSSTVGSVSWSGDSERIASTDDDGTVRVWEAKTGQCLHTERVCKASYQVAFTKFVPKQVTGRSISETILKDPLLVARVIEVGAKARSAVPVTRVVSAKIVLVGESNVGKSYLAHRLVNNAAPEKDTIKSTHGMRLWPLQPEQLHASAAAPEGQRRDIVLWDMGGQDEYRLVHQLFLPDTTVALLLLDPSRGATAFKETETWNKYLQKQLRERNAVKLLVGSKVDQPSDAIDHKGVERLRAELAFECYLETSAVTGRGIDELRESVAKAIDWDSLAKTSRPELFQRIRDEVELRRGRNEVVLHISDLLRAIRPDHNTKEQPAVGDAPDSVVDYSPDPNHSTDEERQAVDTVVKQLAAQGVIACAQVATGEPVLVLQIQELERYAGSLIIAARNNQRGVPALELQALSRPGFTFPGIAEEERLERNHERVILECCVRLLVEHGICFEHERLLVFPTLFPAAASSTEDGQALPHAVSLYYDFAGAIDNIYASLIAWLVLARDFGGIRLWQDRAEFEVKDSGLCGLRKVARAGGYAHLDVYFEADTPETKRAEFIAFVEDHLVKHGLNICERLVANCPKGYVFDDETLHMRVAEGGKDVLCPRCETRHAFTEGAAEARQRDPDIQRKTWALRTRIEKAVAHVAREAVHALARTGDSQPPAVAPPIRVLHLSDLHFNRDTLVNARLRWLLDDVKLPTGLNIQKLDYVVISGDFTDRGCPEGFEKAHEFLSGLITHFSLSAERCILVAGNHDVSNIREAYELRDSAEGLADGAYVKKEDIFLARNDTHYPLRFKQFSDSFYHKLLQRPFPSEYAAQGIAIPFWETRIQFLTLNSSWQIDRFHRNRAGIHTEALAQVVSEAQKQEKAARDAGNLKGDSSVLRIAVWHHAVTSGTNTNDVKISDLSFLTNLQKNGVKLILHGDIHEHRRGIVDQWKSTNMHIIGAGSFGARPDDRDPSTPCLYNLLEISPDHRSVRVHTRQQRTVNGAWEGWYEWPAKQGSQLRADFYEIDLNG